jgi:hypothetical protein
LVDTAPALDTILRTDGVRFVIFHLIDFTGTDLSTVATTLAYVSIHNRIHIQNFKFQIADFKLKTLCPILYALCPMLYAPLTPSLSPLGRGEG